MLCKEINDEKGLKLSKLSEKPPLLKGDYKCSLFNVECLAAKYIV